jgi:transcriptional antiterminator NusG
MANEDNIVDSVVKDTEQTDEGTVEIVEAANTEELIEEEVEELVEAEDDDAEEPVAEEVEELVEAEVDEAEEPVAEEVEELVEAEVDEAEVDEAEEPVAEEAEELVEAEVDDAEEPVAEEAEELVEAEDDDAEEPVAEESEEASGGEAEALDEDTELEEEMPRPDNTQWYVVHSYSGYENKVEKNLLHRIESMSMQDKIFQVVVPTEEEVELKDGHRRTIERRVFPGYILVEMVLDEDSWYVVRNTPGVTGFVGSGNKPTALRDEEVDKILKRMEAEAPKIKVSFKVGEKVRIVEGPFEDFMGTVDEIDLDRTRVRVLVNFFGRETPIELDFLQVERA